MWEELASQARLQYIMMSHELSHHKRCRLISHLHGEELLDFVMVGFVFCEHALHLPLNLNNFLLVGSTDVLSEGVLEACSLLQQISHTLRYQCMLQAITALVSVPLNCCLLLWQCCPHHADTPSGPAAVERKVAQLPIIAIVPARHFVYSHLSYPAPLVCAVASYTGLLLCRKYDDLERRCPIRAAAYLEVHCHVNLLRSHCYLVLQ